MSNKASDHLFELIKNLNKSEKRYFKIFSSRHTIGSENGYIRLFDFLDRMDTYDESLVFGHFHGQAFLNKFSITKARLYANILKSLDTFHSASSIDAQIFRSIHSADILYSKGLYKQCEKILNSAEKQARKHESFNLLLEIKEKQKRLIENELYTQIKPKQITKMHEEEKVILNEIRQYHEMWHTKSLLFQEINRVGKARDKEAVGRLAALVDKVEKVNAKKSSTKVQYLYHHIQSAYLFSINELEKCYDHLKSNISILEKDMLLIKAQPNIYFSLLTNFIYIATKLKKYKEAQVHLSKLKEWRAKNDQQSVDLDVKYFSSVYSLELFLYIENGVFDKALKIIPEIEKGYTVFGEHINHMRKAFIDFKVGVVYLCLGDHSNALKWINNVLNEKRIDQKQDIFCFAQLINLILHFELKNDRFLPYAINSTKRYLKSRNRIYKFEEIFLKLISQISKSDNIFDIQERLIPVEKDLMLLKKDPKEAVVFEYFDFLTWVQSKLKEKSFVDLKKVNLMEEMGV